MKRRHSLAVNIKTDPREDLMQVLRIEMIKIEKIKRALKIEELEEVATIMVDDPLVPKAVMSSVSSVEKWVTLHETVNLSGEQLKEIQRCSTT